MNESLKTALLAQANHELFAALSYEAMGYWCLSEDYSGFAEFFFKQASEEREHASKFFNHLLDRGVAPVIEAAEKPAGTFNRITELARLAQVLEKKNSDMIKECFRIAQECAEYDSWPLLLEFIDEQVEEEAWTAKMVHLTTRAECPGALYNLDRHINKELAE